MATTKFDWQQLPFEEAIAYFEEKRNVDTDTWASITGAEQDAAFVSAGAKGALLEDIRRAVMDAIELGSTLQEFRERFDSIVSERGWDHTGSAGWRSQLIWETNLRASYGKGREAQIQRVKPLRPYAIWRHGGSATPRPAHLANDGNVYPIDERPTSLPHGYGCRCVWFTLSERDIQRLELELSDPLPVPVENGWSQSLGLPSAEERAKLLAASAGRLSPSIAAQVAQEVSGDPPAA